MTTLELGIEQSHTRSEIRNEGYGLLRSNGAAMGNSPRSISTWFRTDRADSHMVLFSYGGKNIHSSTQLSKGKKTVNHTTTQCQR